VTIRKNKRPRRASARKRPVSAARSSGYAGKDAFRSMQLVISGAVFVLLVAVKLLLPERMAQVSGPISGALEQNMDVAEVFSAVSRGFSGEDGDLRESWAELYQAVFGPENAAAGQSVFLPAYDPLASLRAFAEGTGTSSGWLPSFGISGTGAAQEFDNKAVWLAGYPVNTEPGQVVLGFAYSSPLDGTVSSAFGYRENPVDSGEGFHYGLDITAAEGTPITAFADGVVTVTGESSSYGKYLILSHDNDCTTLYAHCSEISVRSGDMVSVGDRIAAAGETGQATGPHLHFELQRSGIYLNPIYYVA